MTELKNHHQITIKVIMDSCKNQNKYSDVKSSLKLFGIYFVRNRTFINTLKLSPHKRYLKLTLKCRYLVDNTLTK